MGFDSSDNKTNFSYFEGSRGDTFINGLERVELSFKSLLKIIRFYHFNRMNIVFIGVSSRYKKQFDLYLRNKSNCSSIFHNPSELSKITQKDFVKQISYSLSKRKRVKTKQTLLVLLSNNNTYHVPTLR